MSLVRKASPSSRSPRSAGLGRLRLRLLTSSPTAAHCRRRRKESLIFCHAMASKPDPNRSRTYYLPRLPREYYQGDAVVHWTLTVSDRAKGWLSEAFHGRFRELMLHAAAREGLFCPAYVLMPDHIHFLWMGLWLESDQCEGMAFLRTYLEPALDPAKFQPQAHDRVLRAEQRRKNAFAETCRYVLDNPVRTGLVEKIGR